MRGRVSQIGVYGMDVTEEKKTQAELEKVKARLECLLDHSPAALYSRLYTDCCRIDLFQQEHLQSHRFFQRGDPGRPLLLVPSISTRKTVICLLKLTAPEL